MVALLLPARQQSDRFTIPDLADISHIDTVPEDCMHKAVHRGDPLANLGLLCSEVGGAR
jgi:hypothetical protein